MKVLTPSKQTLAKYGLSETEWARILESQEGVCFVCKVEPKKGRLCIDHEHLKGWKKMPPDQRKLAVRGLLCWRCNTTYLGRGISVERSRNVTSYLEAHSARQESKPLQLSVWRWSVEWVSTDEGAHLIGAGK